MRHRCGIIYYRMCTSVVTQNNQCPYNGNHKLIPIWLFVFGYIKKIADSGFVYRGVRALGCT